MRTHDVHFVGPCGSDFRAVDLFARTKVLGCIQRTQRQIGLRSRLLLTPVGRVMPRNRDPPAAGRISPLAITGFGGAPPRPCWGGGGGCTMYERAAPSHSRSF